MIARRFQNFTIYWMRHDDIIALRQRLKKMIYASINVIHIYNTCIPTHHRRGKNFERIVCGWPPLIQDVLGVIRETKMIFTNVCTRIEPKFVTGSSTFISLHRYIVCKKTFFLKIVIARRQNDIYRGKFIKSLSFDRHPVHVII